MKLFMAHCGYYDPEIANGTYEFHINQFVVAATLEEAKLRIKADPVYQLKRMHIDGFQEISLVSGYRVQLSQDLVNQI